MGQEEPRRAELVRDVFVAALDLPPENRSRFVRQTCHDLTVANEVCALLELHEQMDGVDGSHGDGAEELVGTRMGAYEVSRLLGAGGMGRVYLARRADGSFQRDVAIKVVDTESPVGDVLQRFREERRILATLRHPYIATMFDAGQTAAGRMYFVMEYVDGHPLTEYCERHALDARSRIDLFLRVCAAVSYAHHHLIIHRDLKPGNILVDVDGQPKLLDFGIAKAVTAARVDPSPTLPLLKRGTPAYASPEHMAGQPAQTTMDVFALGVVLYEVLTGARPAHTKTGDTTRAPALVTRASETLERRSRPSGHRVTARDLAGDLDAILAKALAADWHDRYASVEALAADLRAWMSGHSVGARGGGWMYAAGKFVRRNTGATAAATIAVVALLAATVVLVQLWIVTRAERDRAHRQLEAVRTLAQSLFTAEEQLAATSGTTAVRRLLADSLSDYLAATELGSDRQLLLDTARAYKQVGDIEGNPNEPNLGNPARALAHYDRAVAMLEGLRAGADDHQVTAALASTLAARADVYVTRAEWDRADSGYTQALRLGALLPNEEAQRPDNQELVAGIHRSVGDLRMARDDVAGALAQYHSALALQQAAAALKNSPETRRRTALTQLRLGDTEAASGATGRAQRHYEEAARVLQSLSADLGPRRDLLRDTALSLARLGRIQQETDARQGRRDMDHALRLLRELTVSDPADARTQRDLMVTLTQYANLVALADPTGARSALNEARRIGQMLVALAPADPERARELASVEDRLRDDGLSAAVALRLTRASGPARQIEPGGEPLRIGHSLRVSASAPLGWARYLLVFGPEGPVQVLDQAAMNAAHWTLPVTGPAPAQTVLLVTLPRALTDGERRQLAMSIEDAAGPKVVDFDSHIVWTDRAGRLESVATSRGFPDTRWVADVQKRIAALGDVRLTGRTFPVAASLP